MNYIKPDQQCDGMPWPPVVPEIPIQPAERIRRRRHGCCEAKAEANPTININIGEGGVVPAPVVEAPSKFMYDSGRFDCVGQTPVLLSELDATDPRAFELANVQFSVNWKAMPMLPEMPLAKPRATFFVMYDDGVTEDEVMQIEDTAPGMVMPVTTMFNLVKPGNFTKGKFKLYGKLDMSYMNTPQEPGKYSFQVLLTKEWQ